MNYCELIQTEYNKYREQMNVEFSTKLEELLKTQLSDEKIHAIVLSNLDNLKTCKHNSYMLYLNVEMLEFFQYAYDNKLWFKTNDKIIEFNIEKYIKMTHGYELEFIENFLKEHTVIKEFKIHLKSLFPECSMYSCMYWRDSPMYLSFILTIKL